MLARQPLASLRGGTRVAADDEPRIASSVVSGVRRTLIDLGQWTRVRAHVLSERPEATEWIDTALDRDAWCPIEWHLSMMCAVGHELGDEGAREFGGARLRDNMRGGIIAPILRSWMRSYGNAPGHLMRVTPHIWQAVTRALGKVVVAAAHDREVRFRVIGMPDVARRCTAWHRFLEGYGIAWLEAGSYLGAQVAIAVSPTAGQLDADVTWWAHTIT